MLNQIAQITDSTTQNEVLSFDQLTGLFYSGCKTDEKVGIEYEKLPIYSDNFKAVKYEDIARFMLQFKNGKWDGIYSDNNILGLENETGVISLEPGSQFELSLNPLDSIAQIKEKIDSYNEQSAQLAQKLGITWLGYGIQPLSTYKDIKVIPKKRYRYMSEYLPTVAKRPLVMMRETSGIQVGIDYKSEEDAMKKLALALKLSPIISAVFANSPIRNGQLSSYKSFRALSWLHTDNARCGLISSKIFEKNSDFSNFTFKDYAQVLLNVPMIFIERSEVEGSALAVKNLTFKQFLEHGYEGYYATLKDWQLHCSLYFPEVRLKNFLEIRNHDNQRNELIPCVPAFWKGVMYNESATDEINSILNKFSYIDFKYIRHRTPKYGLDMSIRGYKISDLAKEIINISYEALKNTNEEIYLEAIKELVDSGKTPADIIIKNWEGTWNKDISKLIEYSKLN